MGNPISDSTDLLLAGLEDDVRERAERAVAENSVRGSGLTLSLAEELNLAKAVKYIAAVDGLSREELNALKFLMIMSGIPHELQQHVIEFSTEGVTLENLGALFSPPSRKACYVLCGATTVAAFDGLSQQELQYARGLGENLGIEERLAAALIAQSRAMGLAMQKGDQQMVEELAKVREALVALL